jgi:hypothetical protein
MRIPVPREYEWKLDELGWFVAVALISVVAEALVTFDEGVLTEPDAWLRGLIVGSARAIGGAIVAWLAKRGVAK